MVPCITVKYQLLHLLYKDSLATVRTCYEQWKSKFNVDSWANKLKVEVNKLGLAYIK
jgi:hypothetical protein